MLTRLRNARLVWPTITLIPVLLLLVWLGLWQWNRMTWKAGLVASIQARTAAMPVSLADAARLTAMGREQEYLKVRLTGRFQHGAERHVFVTGATGPGYYIYTPLIAEDAPLQVLVNRGFVTQDLRDPARRAAGQIPGVVEIVGLLRHPRPPDPFTPPSEPDRNQYFHADFSSMAKALIGADKLQLAGFFIEADAAPNPGGWPKGGVTRLDLPNRHLEYALTWWCFAASLIGVYAVFAWQRIRNGE